MTSLDWIIVALTLAAAFAGYAQGFVVGAATLVGFAGGLFLGGRLGGVLIPSGSESPYAPLFALVGALLGGLILGSLMETLGHGVKRRLRIPGVGFVDGLGGALLSGAVALGLAWLAGAVALQTPGAVAFRDEIQRSSILKRLNDALPPSAPVLNALARFDPFPRIDGPSAGVPAPRAAIARDPQVRAAGASVVKIQGSACGHAGGDPRLPRERPVRRARRPGRRHPHRPDAGRLRPRSRPAQAHDAAGRRAPGELGRPDGRHARARRDDR